MTIASTSASSHLHSEKVPIIPYYSSTQCVPNPSSCTLKKVILLIFSLGSLIPSTEGAPAACNPMPPGPDFMSECELDAYCDSYWQGWSPVIVPEGMSPVNALRALQLRIPNLLEAANIRNEPIGNWMRYTYLEIEEGRFIDKRSKYEDNQEEVEKAYQLIGFDSENAPFDNYVDYYEDSLIKTDFISFPLLNARGYDKEYGQGKAQEKINLYNAAVKLKFDVGDKTLERVKQWNPPSNYKLFPHCFHYSRTPEFMKPFLKQKEFSVIQYAYSQIDNFKRWLYG